MNFNWGFDCECITNLRWDSLHEAQRDIARNKVLIPNDKNLLIIVSEYARSYIGINCRGVTLHRGINVICVCGLEEVRKVAPLYLSPHILSRLFEIEQSVGNNCIAFALKRFNHKETCSQKCVQTLQELAYERLFLQFPRESSFRQLFDDGHLPLHLQLAKPLTRAVTLYEEENSFLGVYYREHVFPSSVCKDIGGHMDCLWY